MKAYRAGWLIACQGLVLIGVCVAIKVSPQAILAPFLASAVVCALASLCLVSVREMSSRRGRFPIVPTSALVGGTTAAACVGFADLLGWRGFLLGLLVVVSSPYALRAYRSVPTPSTTQLDAFVRALGYADMGYLGLGPSSDPRALTDEQLCQSWRASCRAVRQRSAATQIAATVEERQGYLDEFERRNPDGFAAWLTSNAREPDSLMPYLIAGRVDHATINWDELTWGRD